MNLPAKVTLIEVGPRDGLQNEKNFVPSEIKQLFIQTLKEAGLQEMELTSFVSPKWVPQMKDASDILKSSSKNGRNIVLAPNRKGVDLALQSGAEAIALFVGVSDTFNQKNINKTTQASMEEIVPIIKELKASGIFVRACISTAFYCPFEGKVSEQAALRLCNEFAEAGADELSVADTIGLAAPSEAYSLFSLLNRHLSDLLLTAHFHDTRKMALANIYASLQAGINRFDSSAGGLGGCPFAPGATGNVATEDVAFMLERMGIQTGIDLPLLVKAIDVVSPALSRNIDTGYYRLVKSAASIV